MTRLSVNIILTILAVLIAAAAVAGNIYLTKSAKEDYSKAADAYYKKYNQYELIKKNVKLRQKQHVSSVTAVSQDKLQKDRDAVDGYFGPVFSYDSDKKYKDMREKAVANFDDKFVSMFLGQTSLGDKPVFRAMEFVMLSPYKLAGSTYFYDAFIYFSEYTDKKQLDSKKGLVHNMAWVRCSVDRKQQIKNIVPKALEKEVNNSKLKHMDLKKSS